MVPPPLSLKTKKEARGYTLVRGDEDSSEDGPSTPVESASRAPYQPRRFFHHANLKLILIGLLSGLLTLVAFNLAFGSGTSRHRGCDCAEPSPSPPQYFQTSPELWAGPTKTGAQAFLAQTRTFDPTATFVPNQPLQTATPIDGMTSQNESIFQMMGYLSPYAPSPGFGVDEYPLPAGAEIVQLQMLSRHGSRYPTSGAGSNVMLFGQRIAEAKATNGFKGTGPLAFLNDWEYQLGYEILVPKGRQELFDSGILHSYMYSSLYNPNSKIIVRTTTQDRMLKSAEYFMAGFFGLEWANNATIEVIIEQSGFNNSLAGSKACPNSGKEAGVNATIEWVGVYLQKGKA